MDTYIIAAENKEESKRIVLGNEVIEDPEKFINKILSEDGYADMIDLPRLAMNMKVFSSMLKHDARIILKFDLDCLSNERLYSIVGEIITHRAEGTSRAVEKIYKKIKDTHEIASDLFTYWREEVLARFSWLMNYRKEMVRLLNLFLVHQNFDWVEYIMKKFSMDQDFIIEAVKKRVPVDWSDYIPTEFLSDPVFIKRMIVANIRMAYKFKFDKDVVDEMKDYILWEMYDSRAWDTKLVERVFDKDDFRMRLFESITTSCGLARGAGENYGISMTDRYCVFYMEKRVWKYITALALTQHEINEGCPLYYLGVCAMGIAELLLSREYDAYVEVREGAKNLN